MRTINYPETTDHVRSTCACNATVGDCHDDGDEDRRLNKITRSRFLTLGRLSRVKNSELWRAAIIEKSERPIPDFVVLDFYFDWGGGGAAMNKAVDDIKVKNPNIVIVDYCIPGQVHSTSTGQKPLRDKLEAQKWYLYQSGVSGSKVLDGTYLTPNHTDFVPKDANGNRWNTWFADYHFDQVWKHINKLDGTFTDNFSGSRQ